MSHVVKLLWEKCDKNQASAYEACDDTRTLLHLAETLEMCKKSKPCLIKKASRCLADCTSKPAKFLSSPFYQTEILRE